MSRGHHRRPPPVDKNALPIQPADEPRLFQLGYYAARASECLLQRIVCSKQPGSFTFVFNRAGQLVQVPMDWHYLLSQKDAEIIRQLALKVMVQNAPTR